MTPQDLFFQALLEAGVLGVGQPASAEDMTTCMFRANMMLAQWSKKRWLVYHLVDVVKVADGSLSYTVGAGGDFNIPRADKVESGFFRQTNTGPNWVDYPMSIIEARENYNQIALKNLSSFPYAAFYDAGYPFGRLYPWPVPSNQFEIHISVKETLAQFTSLAQTINLPPEYEGAIFYNLGCRLRSAYQLPPDPTLVALAKDSLGVLRQANISIAEMSMPDDLVRGGSGYNIYSDNYG